MGPAGFGGSQLLLSCPLLTSSLQETVTVAAKEQQRFGLSQAEIIDRKTFIANLKKQVASISSEMQQAPPAPVARFDL